MILRKANTDDLERIVEIYNTSIEWRLSTADLSSVSLESKRDWFNAHSTNRPLLVYGDADHICGWASIQSFHERAAYINTVEISIYIDHDFIGKGLGTKILSKVITRLPSLNISNAIANIYTHNEASIKLFTNHGFKLWGNLPEVCEMDGNKFSVSILGLKV